MSIKDAVAKALLTYATAFGEVIGVKKFSSVTPDQYGQGTPAYATAVSVKVFLEPEAKAETLTSFGVEVKNAGMFSLGRLAAKAAFPALTLRNTIAKDDAVVVRGETFRVLSVHETGNLTDEPEVLVVFYVRVD